MKPEFLILYVIMASNESIFCLSHQNYNFKIDKQARINKVSKCSVILWPTVLKFNVPQRDLRIAGPHG